MDTTGNTTNTDLTIQPVAYKISADKKGQAYTWIKLATPHKLNDQEFNTIMVYNKCRRLSRVKPTLLTFNPRWANVSGGTLWVRDFKVRLSVLDEEHLARIKAQEFDALVGWFNATVDEGFRTKQMPWETVAVQASKIHAEALEQLGYAADTQAGRNKELVKSIHEPKQEDGEEMEDSYAVAEDGERYEVNDGTGCLEAEQVEEIHA